MTATKSSNKSVALARSKLSGGRLWGGGGQGAWAPPPPESQRELVWRLVMPPVCPRVWVLIESPEMNGLSTRTPASMLWQYTLKTAFVIFKNWNLGKSASYFSLMKRWKVAFVGRGFVCERANERQSFLHVSPLVANKTASYDTGYWKANNTESTRRANSNIKALGRYFGLLFFH